MVEGFPVIGRLRVLHDVSDPQVGKFHTGNCVPECSISIAQIVLCAAAQGIIDVLVIDTGGYIGRIPRPVALGTGDVIFVDGQRGSSLKVDQRRVMGFFFRGRNCVDIGNTGNAHHGCKASGHNLLHDFHSFQDPFK